MISTHSTSTTPHHLVEALEIQEGTHFRAAHLEFVDGLNCLVGGAGAGKTTLLQSLRHALGVAATDQRAAQNTEQVRATLGPGELTARVRTQHGARYTSQCHGDEAPRITVTGTETAANVSLDSELFKINMYAQNEIQEMSKDPGAQLALLDGFADSEIAALEERIGPIERRLDVNAAQVLRLDAEIEELAGKTSELPTARAALEAIIEVAGPNADEARRGHEAKVLRGREQATLRGLREELRAVLVGADAFEADARRRLGGASAPNASLAASPNRAAIELAQSGARDALAAIHDAATRVRAAISSAESGATTAGDLLGAAHAGQDAAYDVLNKKHDADRGRIVERDRLQKRLLELETQEKKLEGRRTEHAAKSAEAQTLRDERARLIQTELGVRQRVGKEITEALDARLRVTVIGGADTRAYLALLLEIVKGAGLRVDMMREIARNIRPDDLAALVRAKDPGPLMAIDDIKANKAERAQKVIDALRKDGQVARLDTVRLGDVPVLELKIDGGNYRVSTELSAGQKCMAILLILLIQSAAPLIIDQPEDQLDNAFIYDVLVPALKVAKLSRQIIFATHSPNILVLGESNRVFVVESANSIGSIVEFGTIDEVRGAIERRVEGGREAFLRRSERYGHAPATGAGEKKEEGKENEAAEETGERK